MKKIEKNRIESGMCLGENIICGSLCLQEGTVITENIIPFVKNADKHIVLIKERNDFNIVHNPLFDHAVKVMIDNGISTIFKESDNVLMTQYADSISDCILSNIAEKDNIQICVEDLYMSNTYLFQHSIDVAIISSLIGKELNYSKSEVKALCNAGLLHDIGKLFIDDSIIEKPGKLTDEEFEQIKMHPIYGEKILELHNNLSDDVVRAIIQHHEKVDGSGYPFGLKGNQITVFAKCLMVADVYDALVTKRPYHQPFLPAKALDMIQNSNGHFDLEFIDAFTKAVTLYPVGEKVMLSSNEWATVAENRSEYPTMPTVVTDSGIVIHLYSDVAERKIVMIDSLYNRNDNISEDVV